MTTEPEYLYRVDALYNKPRVERVRVVKRTKMAVWFADRPLIVGCRSSWPHEDAAKHLASTPLGAIEKWHEEIRKRIADLEEEILGQRALLSGPDPKNAWETK